MPQGKNKRANNDIQNTTYKTEEKASLTPLKLRVNSGAPE